MQHIKHHWAQRWVPAAEHRHKAATENREDEQPRRKISGQAKLLLTIHGMFAAANALSGTFVNVYLWKVKNDFALIGWFALYHQITMAITFWVAGKWVKEHNKMNSLRLGVAVSAVFYLVILFLGRRAVDFVPLLGIIQGMSSGFFWLAFNVVYFEVTDPENRDKFNGWAGLLASSAGMFGPWISGILITHMNNALGYRVIFTISLGVFVAGVAASFFLKKRKVQGSYEWFHSLKQLKESGNSWRRIVPALAAQGVREGVFGFIIGLLVYIATTNEQKVGNFSLYTSAVAFLGFYIVGKILKPKFRSTATLIGAIMMVVVIFPFFWNVNYFTLLFFGIGSAVFFPLFTIPMTSTVFDMIGRNEESAKHRVEFVVLRELALNAGRMLGTVIFILVISNTQKPLAINLLLLGLGSSTIPTWFFMRKLLRRPASQPGIAPKPE